VNICGISERYLAARQPLPWLLYYLFVSFCMFLGASWLNVSDASFDNADFHKKIGLYWSVNWTITFLLLYPVFLFFAIRGTRAIRGFWHDATAWQLVTGPEGKTKGPTNFIDEWESALAKCNIVATLFIVICIAIGSTDFYKTAAGPLLTCAISYTNPASNFSAPIDWSTIPIFKTNACEGHQPSLLALSSLLYVLMVVSLTFYLIFLFYSAYVFDFLAKVSRRDGESRLVFRPKQLQSALAPTIENLMMCVVLGLSVCALMQAHFAYLRSIEPDPVAFLTSDIERLATPISKYFDWGNAQARTGSQDFLAYQQKVVSKGLVLIPLVVTIIGCGIAGIAQLFDSIRNSLFYTQEKLQDHAWTKRVGISEQEKSAIRTMSHFSAFMAIMPPYGLVYLVICALLILSIVLSSFFIFLCSAAVIFMHRLVSKYLMPKPTTRMERSLLADE
jgi:hypothetical protein